MEIKRDFYLNKLVRKMNNDMIKIITGLRRSGKSYLLFNIFKKYLLRHGIKEENIIEINLEDIKNKELRNPDSLYKYVKGKAEEGVMNYILLDEVQLVDDFFDVINGFRLSENMDVYVIGSNSKFLSSDVATEFRGRGDVLHLYPLSFSEFMSCFDGDIYDCWENYYRYGGLPYLVNLKTSLEKQEYLKALFKNVYFKDIIQKNNLSKNQEVEDLLEVVASCVGSLTNPLKLKNTFRSVKHVSISDVTIKKYLGYFEDSFLIDHSLRYDILGKNYILSPLKYYFEDIGLRNAVVNFRQNEENRLMENIVFNELKRRGFSVDVGKIECFGKDENNKTIKKNYETDFVLNRGDKRSYIQVALNLYDEEKTRKEKEGLLKIKDNFEKIILVSGKKEKSFDDDGIVIMGILNFLLDDDSI